MDPRETRLTVTTLLLAGGAFAGDFTLNALSAQDLRPSFITLQPAAPAFRLGDLGEEETTAYLADREAAAEEPGRAAAPAAALGGDGVVRLYHQWHRERVEVRYRDERGNYIPSAIAQLRRLFRCRLTGRETELPVRLIEIIDALQDRFGGAEVTVICGYRSPELNGSLAAGSGAVAKNSLHMRGLAADIRIQGVRTSALRDAARALRAGGVGYYPADGFVHVDIGPVRYW